MDRDEYVRSGQYVADKMLINSKAAGGFEYSQAKMRIYHYEHGRDPDYIKDGNVGRTSRREAVFVLKSIVILWLILNAISLLFKIF